MRISSSQIQIRALNALLEQQTRVSTSQLQLSSGKRILSPSDDPIGTARVVGLEKSLRLNTQYQRNADMATGRLQLEETSLTGIENTLQRIRELALQGNNGSQTANTRADIAQEIRLRLSELLDISNARDANGEYIFSGFKGYTQPFSQNADGTFTYSGDQGARSLQIAANRQVQDRDPGSEVFQFIKNGNGTFTTLDNQANTGSGIIDPGTVTNASQWDPDTYTVRFAKDTAATDVTVAAFDITDTGAADVPVYTLRVNGTAVYEVDDAGTVTVGGAAVATIEDLSDRINAQSGTTNVRSEVFNNTLHFSYLSPSTTPITIQEELSAAGDPDDNVVGYFGTTLEDNSTNDISITTSDASHYYVTDSAGNIETNGSYQTGSVIAFNGIQTDVKGSPSVGDLFTISPSANQDLFTTVNNLVVALETNTSVDLNNAVNRFLTDIDRGMDNISGVRSKVGARLNSIEDQTLVNEDFNLQIEQIISSISDLDFAEATTRLNFQLVALEAAQQSYVRIQGLSLFNYL